METLNRAIPIEVKFRNEVQDTELIGLKAFMKTKKSPFGIVVTKKLLDMKDNVVFIPRNFSATAVTSLLMRKRRVDRVKISKVVD